MPRLVRRRAKIRPFRQRPAVSAKADRDDLLGWIEQGCPKGEAADQPAAGRIRRRLSTIGKPDAVFYARAASDFTVPSSFTVPKAIRYQYFSVKTNFDEDRWIQAAECRPGNRAVVHHIIVYVQGGTPVDRQEKQLDGIGAGFLAAYAPGDMPAVFPAGTAKRIPKGATLRFQMHYTPTGTEEKDRSSVGLIFSKTPPKYEVRTRGIAQQLLVIPAGSKNHEVLSRSTFSKDAELLSLLPHMHLRGKDFKYEVLYPDGMLAIRSSQFPTTHLCSAEQLPSGPSLKLRSGNADSLHGTLRQFRGESEQS